MKERRNSDETVETTSLSSSMETLGFESDSRSPSPTSSLKVTFPINTSRNNPTATRFKKLIDYSAQKAVPENGMKKVASFKLQRMVERDNSNTGCNALGSCRSMPDARNTRRHSSMSRGEQEALRKRAERELSRRSKRNSFVSTDDLAKDMQRDMLQRMHAVASSSHHNPSILEGMMAPPAISSHSKRSTNNRRSSQREPDPKQGDEEELDAENDREEFEFDLDNSFNIEGDGNDDGDTGNGCSTIRRSSKRRSSDKSKARSTWDESFSSETPNHFRGVPRRCSHQSSHMNTSFSSLGSDEPHVYQERIVHSDHAFLAGSRIRTYRRTSENKVETEGA